MKGLWSTMNFELRFRRDLFVLAAAGAGISFLMPFLPGVAGYGTADVIVASSTAISVILASLMALFLGASVFGRDLAEGRFGFFFARPISSMSIWGGRLGAVLVTVLACELVAAIPLLVMMAFGYRMEPGDLAEFIAVAVAIPVLLLLLSHSFGIMLRARTAWLALDLAGLLVTTALIGTALQPLLIISAGHAAVVVTSVLGLGIGLALLAASAVQVAFGRTSLIRSHRWLSTTLWPAVIVVAILIAVWSRWITTPLVGDLHEATVLAVSANGPWIEVMGPAPGHLGYMGHFLLDLETGRNLQLPPIYYWYENEVVFSSDGRRVAWIQPPQEANGGLLMILDLDGSLEPESTRLSFGEVKTWTLSASGERMAVVEENLIAVYDVSDGSLLTSSRLWTSKRVILRFMSEAEVLVIQQYEQPGPGMVIQIDVSRLDVASGSITETFSVDDLESFVIVKGSPDLERLVLISRKANRRIVQLRETLSGDLLWEQSAETFVTIRFIADNEMLVASSEDGRARLRQVSAHGELVADHDLGPANWFTIGGVMGGGQILLARQEGPDNEGERGWETLSYDLATGETRYLADDAYPMTASFWGAEGSWQGNPGVAHQLLRSKNGEISLIEADGSTRRLLFGSRVEKDS